jgi:hypothetical protein
MRTTLNHIAAIILVPAAVACGGDAAHSPSADAGGSTPSDAGGAGSGPAFDASAGPDAGVEAGVSDGAAIVEEAHAAPCLDLGAPCFGPDECCFSVCAGDSTRGLQTFCTRACSDSSQCASGCCAPLTTSAPFTPTVVTQVCAAAGYCSTTCSGAGASCTSSDECCAGYACAGDMTCEPTCTKNADCTSGCCLEAFTASGQISDLNVCSPAPLCIGSGEG